MIETLDGNGKVNFPIRNELRDFSWAALKKTEMALRAGCFKAFIDFGESIAGLCMMTSISS